MIFQTLEKVETIMIENNVKPLEGGSRGERQELLGFQTPQGQMQPE